MDGAFDLDRVGGRRALDDLVAAVVEAGHLALQLFHRGAWTRVERKPDRTPVTEADRAVEAHVRAHLERHHPATAILGEEEGASGVDGADLRWVVDPIDGTKAFIRGLPTWSVLVGLEADGEPALGIAYLPADDDLYVGVVGEGAYGDGRRLEVSRCSSVAECTISHGSLAQFTDLGLGDLLTRLGQGTESQRGFADFDGYRRLLHGRVDAMIDPGVAPWDICAPAALVRAAGGRLTSLDGADSIHRGSAVASNGVLHDELLALLHRDTHTRRAAG